MNYKNETIVENGQKYEVRVYENGDKFWYQNSKLHRLNGPAIEYDGDKWYWIEGECYTYEEWKLEVAKRTNLIKELTVSEVSKLLGYQIKIVKD